MACVIIYVQSSVRSFLALKRSSFWYYDRNCDRTIITIQVLQSAKNCISIFLTTSVSQSDSSTDAPHSWFIGKKRIPSMD